jgi:hypothetical protein
MREVICDRYFPNVPLVAQQGQRVKFYDDLIRDEIDEVRIYNRALSAREIQIDMATPLP